MLSTEEQLQQSQTENVRLAQRNELLEEENRWLKQQLFGRSTEKLDHEQLNPDQGWLFNEAEVLSVEPAPEPVVIPSYERKQAGRKKLSAELPRVEVIHDLTDDQKICAVDGTALKRIGEETSEQLDYQPAKIRVIRNVRPTYACPCCKGNVVTAPAPLQWLPKSMATPSLVAHITTAKFVDGTPLYRQEPQFARLGIELGRGTMAQWLMKVGGIYVLPIINLLHEVMLSHSLIHCDETRLQVLKSDKAPTSDHWMWIRASGPPGQRLVLFDYDASRSGAVPTRLLEGYRGALITDGYEPYNAVARVLNIEHAGCFAHARRKFDEAHKASSKENTMSHAKEALALIGELYKIERDLWNKEQPLTPEQRISVRQQRSKPIIERFERWLIALAPKVLPQSLLGKAVHYTLNQWPKLTVFLTNGEVPLDNNRAENAIRPFVIGRKNWLFADTVKGAIASANLYSLVETAKANGVEPHAYLTKVFERLPYAKSVEDFEALLPWSLKAEIAATRSR